MTAFKHTFWACALLLISTGAYAQNVPKGADAGRIEEQLDLDIKPIPRSLFAKPVQQSNKNSLIPGAEKFRFVLKKLNVDGTTVYSQHELSQYYQSLVGKEISVADLYDVATKITNRYREDGYIVAEAFVPEQSIVQGSVRLGVIEPYIDDIIIDGEYYDSRAVRKLLAPWKAKKILNIKDLENTMLLLNDLPGTGAESVLEPKADMSNAKPGAMTLRLQFATIRVRPKISFDNYGSRFIGPYQIGEKFTFENAFGHMAQTQVQLFQATQWSELGYASVAHSMPVMWPGLTLDVAANYSRIIPGDSLEVNKVKSYAKGISIGLKQSIVRSRNKNLDIGFSLENRRNKTKVLGSRFYDDRTTVAELQSTLDIADNWAGYNIVNLKLRKGLDILGTRETGALDLSRLEGHSDFTTIQMQAVRIQEITDHISLYGAIRGQYAAQPLLSSEEFGYGGNFIGRAYNASEIVGDRGVAALVEARYRAPINDKITLRPYIFYDFGKVWNTDRVDNKDFTAASTGLGVRSDLMNGLSLDAVLAKPLTKSIETPQYGDGKSSVLKFSLEYQF